jgi:hypothetical protein
MNVSYCEGSGADYKKIDCRQDCFLYFNTNDYHYINGGAIKNKIICECVLNVTTDERENICDTSRVGIVSVFLIIIACILFAFFVAYILFKIGHSSKKKEPVRDVAPAPEEVLLTDEQILEQTV